MKVAIIVGLCVIVVLMVPAIIMGMALVGNEWRKLSEYKNKEKK